MTISRVALHGVSSVRFAGDAAILAVTPDGLVRVTNDGKVTHVLALKYPGVLAVTPDQRLAMVGDGKKVFVVDIATAAVVMNWSSTGEDVGQILPSPDGRRVLVAGLDEGGTVKLYEVGVKRALFTIGGCRYARVAWIDNARFVTTNAQTKTFVNVHDADNKGAVLVDVGKPGLEIHNLIVIDGVAACAGNKGLSRVRLEAGGKKELWWASAKPIHAIVRDSARAGGVFVGGEDGVHRVDANGSALRIADGNVTDMDVRAVLNDESRLAFTTSDEVVITTIEGGIS